jgi:hypothetical protein
MLMLEDARAALLRYLESAMDADTYRADDGVPVGLEVLPLRMVLEALADDSAVIPSWICNERGLVYGTTYGELVAWIRTRLEG